MISQQLLKYIKQQLQQGISRDQIKNSLMANGWRASDIIEAFAKLSDNSVLSNTVQSYKPAILQSKSSMKILFIVISIVGLIIIVAGISAYFWPSINPFKKQGVSTREESKKQTTEESIVEKPLINTAKISIQKEDF